MESAKQPSGSLAILYISTLLERLAYYGFRSAIVLFMVATIDEGGLGLDVQTGLSFYGTFTAMVYLFPILGGLIADFLIPKRYAMKLACLITAAAVIAVPSVSESLLMICFGVMAFGFGLFKVSNLSLFSLFYSSEKYKLSGVFTIYYMVVNVGALLGGLSIGLFGDAYGWAVAFYFVAGVLLVVSLLLYFFKGKLVSIEENAKNKSSRSSDSGILVLLLVAFLNFFVWTIYELINGFLWETGKVFPSDGYFQVINPAVITIASVFLAIVWFAREFPVWIKLGIGIIFYGVSWQLTGIAVSDIDNINLSYLIAGQIMFAISEALFVPIFLALIAEYSSRKLLATSFS
ncbi:MAG: MFS transporter, partial [Kangiellaceae bacterium]|nr:MFS transporter [Kangiellaceae bacterium]